MTDRLDKLIARDVHPAVHICCISCQTRSQLAVRGPGATSLYAWCCLGTVNTIYHAIDDGAATTIDRDPPCGARATIAAFSQPVAITVRGRGGEGHQARAVSMYRTADAPQPTAPAKGPATNCNGARLRRACQVQSAGLSASRAASSLSIRNSATRSMFS